ncbi:retroviral-like aspartic protease family protein [Algoriphagus aquatilis]|uniref:Retroviral-like aspartic protease family protein n=1 Tax=Algoriphagus aquatilis TaxID=490186 RepID=A0ABW0BZ75_9BACT
MQIISKRVFILLLLFISAYGTHAQESVYTFPFHLESSLLVFEGTMNGVPTKFAFDTGAAMGMANSLSEPSGKLKVKGKKITLRDSNNQLQKVPTGLTKELEIGGVKIEKVRSLVNDMDFLFCMDFFLLGQDVIKQLNWEIDFEKMQIRVSKAPFPTNPTWKKLPIQYKGGRPHVTLSFENLTLPDALVDFGYVRVMDFPDHLPEIQTFLSLKDSLGLSNPNISTSMGAVSQSTYPTRSIWVDSLQLGDEIFPRVPIDFEESSYPKIGVGFFEVFSTKTILNHSEMAYYLELRTKPEFEETTHIGVMYEDGKLILNSKPQGLTPQDAMIEVGEEIKSINGFSAADFDGICSYFKWSVKQKPNPVELVKMDGTKLFFEKIPLK